MNSDLNGQNNVAEDVPRRFSGNELRGGNYIGELGYYHLGINERPPLKRCLREVFSTDDWKHEYRRLHWRASDDPDPLGYLDEPEGHAEVPTFDVFVRMLDSRITYCGDFWFDKGNEGYFVVTRYTYRYENEDYFVDVGNYYTRRLDYYRFTIQRRREGDALLPETATRTRPATPSDLDLCQCGDQNAPAALLCVHLVEGTAQEWCKVECEGEETDDWACAECCELLEFSEIEWKALCLHCARALRKKAGVPDWKPLATHSEADDVSSENVNCTKQSASIAGGEE